MHAHSENSKNFKHTKLHTPKKIFILAIALLFSLQCIAFAAPSQKEEKSLPQKYGYDEGYEYNDESIAHVLKSATVYIECIYSADLTYNTISLVPEKIVQTASLLYEENPTADPELIYSFILDDIIENTSRYADLNMTKTSEIMLGARGSGVVISEDGYIATNSHVVNAVSEQDIENNLENCIYEEIFNDWESLVAELIEIGFSPTESQEDGLFNLIVDTAFYNPSYGNEKTSYYVCFPSASGDTSIDASRTFEASLIKDGTPVTSVDNAGLTEDAAIIKIDAQNLIALNISDSYPQSNSKIVSAGFPAAANEIFTMNTENDASILSVTIGTGNISRLVPIDNTKYKSIEITTTIAQGSSGGPSVDSKLDIEGLNTYGNSSDMRFAYMIPAEFVKDLAKGCDVGRGETTKLFLTAVQMLEQNYGGAAHECFKELQRLNGDIPYLDNLIKLAKSEPANYPEGSTDSAADSAVSEDKESNESDMLTRILIIVGSGLVAVAIVALTIVLIMKKKKAKKSAATDEYTPNPEPEIMVHTPVTNCLPEAPKPSPAPEITPTSFVPSEDYHAPSRPMSDLYKTPDDFSEPSPKPGFSKAEGYEESPSFPSSEPDVPSNEPDKPKSTIKFSKNFKKDEENDNL